MRTEVYCGHIGLVFSNHPLAGPSGRETALSVFREYREQSKSGYGRAAGESVVLMKDGEIFREHVGQLNKSSAD